MADPSRLADAPRGAPCGPPAEAPSSRARILVADDEPLILQGLRRLLEQDGYKVSTALGGREAVRKASETPFDVVVSDVHMPDIDGLELLRTLRDLDEDIAVVLMTGDPQAETASSAVALGASHYLPKPVDHERLRRTIEQAVLFRRTARAVRASQRPENSVGGEPLAGASADAPRLAGSTAGGFGPKSAPRHAIRGPDARPTRGLLCDPRPPFAPRAPFGGPLGPARGARRGPAARPFGVGPCRGGAFAGRPARGAAGHALGARRHLHDGRRQGRAARRAPRPRGHAARLLSRRDRSYERGL